MPRIRITGIGDQVILPKGVKEAFSGLEFPVVKVLESQKPLIAHGFHGSAAISCKAAESAYFVKVTVVLSALQKKCPDAAKWLKVNTLMSSGSGLIGFDKNECVEIA